MPIELRKVRLEASGPFWEEGNNFFFTAVSITEDFACKYVQEILAEQSPGNALVFRHRHPAATDSKVIPIFGRVHESKVVLEDEKYNMETVYRVPIKAPNGKDILDNVAFAEWVKKSYEAKDPIKISLQYTISLDEDGKAYFANIIEHTGTHYPACTACVNTLPTQEVVALEENGKKSGTPTSVEDIKKMDAKQLEELLEQRTLEKKTLEEKLVKLEGEVKNLAESEQSLKSSLEESGRVSNLLETLSGDFTKLKMENDALKREFEFQNSEEKGVIDEIIKLEKEPDFVPIYRTWTLEKLRAHLKKLEGKLKPQPDVQNRDPLASMRNFAKKQLETGEPTQEQILKNINPAIRAEMEAFYKKKGGA
jgi:hypothetical protein